MELNELKEILMGMLLTSPTENTERNMYLREISERERHNATIIERQEVELQAALDDKENEVILSEASYWARLATGRG